MANSEEPRLQWKALHRHGNALLLKTKRWLVSKVSPAWPLQQQGWLARPGGSPGRCPAAGRTGPRCRCRAAGDRPGKELREWLVPLLGGNEDSSSHSLSRLLSLLGLYCWSYPQGDEPPRRGSQDAARAHTHAQTRPESRSREETREERRGCFKEITAVPTRRRSWTTGRGVRAAAPGSARRGAPGRRARARCGPSPGRRRRDAHFSQSGCGRGDPTRAEEPPDPRICRGFGVGRPSSRRAPVPRAPPLATPNFGQRRAGSVPGTSRVRSGRRSWQREPGYLQPRAPRAKSGSESWIPAPLGATSRPRRRLPVRRLGRREPALSSLAAPSRGSLPLESALLAGCPCRGHRPSSVSCRNSGSRVPASPGARAPSGAGSRALPRANRW